MPLLEEEDAARVAFAKDSWRPYVMRDLSRTAPLRVVCIECTGDFSSWRDRPCPGDDL